MKRAFDTGLMIWVGIGILALAAGLATTLIAIIRLDWDLFKVGIGVLIWAAFTGFSGGVVSILFDRYNTAVKTEEEPVE